MEAGNNSSNNNSASGTSASASGTSSSNQNRNRNRNRNRNQNKNRSFDGQKTTEQKTPEQKIGVTLKPNQNEVKKPIARQTTPVRNKWSGNDTRRNSQQPRVPREVAIETKEDIERDIRRIEKEIILEIQTISTMKL
jgi:hypothetical protein